MDLHFVLLLVAASLKPLAVVTGKCALLILVVSVKMSAFQLDVALFMFSDSHSNYKSRGYCEPWQHESAQRRAGQ